MRIVGRNGGEEINIERATLLSFHAFGNEIATTLEEQSRLAPE